MAVDGHEVSRSGGRVTLQDIAQRLHVSIATVSLALRDAPVVADATRRRVQKLARELGYSYNRGTMAVRTTRTNMLAVGVHDITNPYFAEMLTAIEAAAAAAGQGLLLGTYGESAERQDRVLSSLRENRPDGMLLCPAGETTHDAYDALVAAAIPIVQISREIQDSGLDFVGADDVRGATLAVEHLVGLGHRRIAMIGGNARISTGRARHKGFRDAMAAAGLDPSLVYEGYGSRETGLAGIKALFGTGEPPTAAVCFNDVTAFGVLLGLRHLGLDAPKDLSVVGCDDVAEAALWYPGLTTIRNRHGEIGAEATELLLRRIAEPNAGPKRVLLPPSLVIRGSTARLEA